MRVEVKQNWKKNAEKELETFSKEQVKKIKAKIEEIPLSNPNLDILKLHGSLLVPTYRLRIGRYRIIFEIHEH